MQDNDSRWLSYFLAGALVTAIGVIIILGSRETPVFGGGDATQIPAVFSTSTAQSVATSATVITATSTGCTSRNISTSQQGIMLTFDDSKTPTGTFGVWQGASTTVAYSAAEWGCGLMRAISNTAASNITLIVFR